MEINDMYLGQYIRQKFAKKDDSPSVLDNLKFNLSTFGGAGLGLGAAMLLNKKLKVKDPAILNLIGASVGGGAGMLGGAYMLGDKNKSIIENAAKYQGINNAFTNPIAAGGSLAGLLAGQRIGNALSKGKMSGNVAGMALGSLIGHTLGYGADLAMKGNLH